LRELEWVKMQRDVTQLLLDWNDGDEKALSQLMPLVYDELHRLAESCVEKGRGILCSPRHWSTRPI